MTDQPHNPFRPPHSGREAQQRNLGSSREPGRHFQVATRYERDSMAPHWLDWEHMPPTYKVYRDVPIVPLPPPVNSRTFGPDEGAAPGDALPGAGLPGAALFSAAVSRADLWECITRRRSIRAFGRRGLSTHEISVLLWASAGITGAAGQYLRAAPSAGALYPIETYVAVHAVDGVEPGIYHYRLVGTDDHGRAIREGGHALEQLRRADVRRQMATAALDQDIAADCAAVFIWTAVFARSIWKYRQRAYRYVYLDAGHVAQNLLLAATALGLGACPIAAFYDSEVERLLGMEGEDESPLYMAVVGRE